MKLQHLIVILACFTLLSSCFVAPILIIGSAIDNSDTFAYNEASEYEGTYISMTEQPQYTLTLIAKNRTFEGNIIVMQGQDTLENCTFHKDSRITGLPGTRAALTCTRPDETVKGSFSFEVDERTNIMTIFGVDGSLDLAIPNNLELKKVPPVGKK